MIEQVKKLPVEIVEGFLADRDAIKYGIPADVADYILQINCAQIVHKANRSITEAAVKLQKEYPKLSLSTCRQRIYDSINFINSSSTVTAEAWNLYFADEMMKLHDLNIITRDFKEARLCIEKAREYRIEAAANIIDPDRIKFKPQIVSPDIEIERMGIKKQGLLSAFKKAMKLIDQRAIPEAEKLRLKGEVERELDIQTIEPDATE
jgi:hypothetical protein